MSLARVIFGGWILMSSHGVALAHEQISLLLIGDSHTYGTFGGTLDTLLRSREGTTVKSVGSCGLSPNGFLKGLNTHCGLRIHATDQTETNKTKASTPAIDALLEETRPAITVIALGANQIQTATSHPTAQRAFVDRLVTKILESGSRCLWIGPPHGRNKPEPQLSNLYRVLEAGIAGRCAFFDSRPAKLPYLHYDTVAAKAGKKGDGRHYDALGAPGRTVLRRWALDAYRALEREL